MRRQQRACHRDRHVSAPSYAHVEFSSSTISVTHSLVTLPSSRRTVSPSCSISSMRDALEEAEVTGMYRRGFTEPPHMVMLPAAVMVSSPLASTSPPSLSSSVIAGSVTTVRTSWGASKLLRSLSSLRSLLPVVRPLPSVDRPNDTSDAQTLPRRGFLPLLPLLVPGALPVRARPRPESTNSVAVRALTPLRSAHGTRHTQRRLVRPWWQGVASVWAWCATYLTLYRARWRNSGRMNTLQIATTRTAARNLWRRRDSSAFNHAASARYTNMSWRTASRIITAPSSVVLV